MALSPKSKEKAFWKERREYINSGWEGADLLGGVGDVEKIYIIWTRLFKTNKQRL